MSLDEHLNAIRERLQTARRTPLAARPLEMVDSALGALDDLEARLTEVQDYVTIADGSPDDARMPLARKLWDALSTDSVISRRDRLLSELVTASPTLSLLNRSAVDIKSVYAYSPQRLAQAAAIAQLAKTHPQYLPNLARDDHATFGIASEAFRAVRALIDELTRRGVLSGFSLEGQVASRGSLDWRPVGRIRNPESARSWRVRRGTVAEEDARFLNGHWLTAYAYSIARDQFDRVGKPYEIYSNVEYALPLDQGGGRSDIDVLVSTPTLLLSIECKAGRVLTSYQNRPTAAAKTLTSAARLDRILTDMQVTTRREYQLVHLAREGESNEAVRQRFGAAAPTVLVAVPAELRGVVQRIAEGQSVNREDLD